MMRKFTLLVMLCVAPCLAGAKIVFEHVAYEHEGEKLDGFLRSMDAHDIDCQFIAYAGAVHAFTNKDADKLAEQNKLKGVGYQEDAARRAWGHAEVFLKEMFEQTK